MGQIKNSRTVRGKIELHPLDYSCFVVMYPFLPSLSLPLFLCRCIHVSILVPPPAFGFYSYPCLSRCRFLSLCRCSSSSCLTKILCLSLYPNARLPVCLNIYPTIPSSVCLSVCLSLSVSSPSLSLPLSLSVSLYSSLPREANQ